MILTGKYTYQTKIEHITFTDITLLSTIKKYTSLHVNKTRLCTFIKTEGLKCHFVNFR